jgi:hypothetical protein
LTVRYDDRFHPSPKEVGTVVNSVKVLQIETRQEGTSTIVLQQTETTTSAVTVPLNIFAGPTIQRNTVVTKPIDLAQALRDAFGYQIAAISPPPPLDKRKIVEGFLALPAGSASSFTAQQRDLLGEVLREVAEKPTLSDTDIDFVRRTVADDRVTNGSVGGIIQTMFYKHPAQFEPLIPVVLERMTHPAGDTAYKGALGWSLRNFSADRLQPYRDKMMSIVETEGKGPSNGVG